LASNFIIDRSASESALARWFIPIVLFLTALWLVGSTLKDYGVAWDEPPYFYASNLHLRWFIELGDSLGSGDVRQSLADQSIKAAWHWNPYNVPHPPFSRIISGLAKLAFDPFLDKFSAYRMGPALFFAALVAVMYLWTKELFGRATGLFSTLAVILTPNLFGYAHIAVTDLPLASMWFLTTYCFWKGLYHWKWSVALGIAWGLALATKFPAALIPLPLILWAHVFHRDKYVNNFFALLFLAPVFMIVSQPYLWHQTGLRILEFLYEGISRAYRPDANFMIYFYHQLLFTHQLPWYYPFFIVGVTTPEPLIILAILGGIASLWMAKQRSTILLFVTNAVFVLVLGLMPGAVLHDGVRQMLSALPFLAALAGAGFCALASGVFKLGQRWSIFMFTHHKTILSAILILLTFALPAFDQISYHPFQLSYYNRLIGGIPGAYTDGLETTYFLEALNPELLDTLNKTLPENAIITASFANFMLSFYQQEGRLRKDIKIATALPFDFYLLVNRRSVLGPRERNLVNAGVKTFASVSVTDTPLVAVYDFRKRH
jgi:4-amino-4-deoxy-L-arabinose transferase-like glycosyltransferase